MTTSGDGHPDGWPAAVHETRPWRQTVRGCTRADRTFCEVSVTLPALLADRDVPLTAGQAADVEDATREITALDNARGEVLRALGVLLLRTSRWLRQRSSGWRRP